ncbi:MAG: tyrosinase family protein [Actinobacteria bacterium]|nr:tyrosinase family protein [Actinomycetota bacterium]MCL5882491.1 tyrosinase family protein [Actinomycetota bacterium]
MSGPPIVNSLSPPERSELVKLMLPFLTDEVVAAHTKIIHFGEETFIGHSAYISELEDFLSSNGGRRFVPLPQWDPAEPIPPEFNVVRARDDGAARPPLMNLDPRMPLPERFVMPRLCEFIDAGTLGNELNPWHIHVHTTVGGALGKFRIASAAPIFWCFHVFVGGVYHQWLRSCKK